MGLPTPLRRTTCILAFGAGWLCAAWALDRVLPMWASPIQREKLEHLAAHGERYDTLFLGPSTMNSGLDPLVFDEVNARSGRPTRSLNLGFPGAHLFSQEWFLEQVLERRPPGLERIVLEVEGVHDRELANWPALTPKMVAWHDLQSTREALRLFEQQGAASRDLTLGHWSAYAHRLLDAGRAQPWVEAALGVAEPESSLGPNGDGYRPLRATDSETHQLRSENFRRGRRKYVRMIQRWMRRTPAFEHPPVLLEKLARMQRRCDEAGVELVVITVAGAHEGSAAVPAHELGLVRTLLRFDDVAAHAELFHPRNRFDRTHFNPRGAELFSALLAERLFRGGRAQ